MDKKLFGMRINKARKDRGLTAEKLAEACNINSTYLRQIEGGKKLPSLPVFATYAANYEFHRIISCQTSWKARRPKKFKKFFLSPIRRRPRSRCLRRWLGSF